MIVTLRAAVAIAFKLVGVNELTAVGTLEPAAKTILFRRSNLNFGFISRK